MSQASSVQVALPAHEIPALNGNNAPIGEEIDGLELTVRGAFPSDFSGMYVRNGPNAFYPPDWRCHAYDGDGLQEDQLAEVQVFDAKGGRLGCRAYLSYQAAATRSQWVSRHLGEPGCDATLARAQTPMGPNE